MSEPPKQLDLNHPWLGLPAFSFEDQGYFFGRDQEINEIYERARQHPLTVLFGRSGLGKTSLLGAGLLPRLKVEGRSASLLRLRLDSEARPLIAQVRAELCRLLGEGEENHLWVMIHHRSRRKALEMARPVLIFDQLEELFTLTRGRSELEERRRRETIELMEELACLIENRPPADLGRHLLENRNESHNFVSGAGPLRVVFALREDYLHALEAWKKVIPSLMRNRMALHALDGKSAFEAVYQPGQLGGRELVTREVARAIVCFVAKRELTTDLTDIEAVPPLISLICFELNLARLEAGREQITWDQLNAQKDDILQNFYNRSFEGLPAAVRRAVEDRLVTKFGDRDTAAQDNLLADLEDVGIHSDEARRSLESLILARLLTAEDRGGIQRLELTHDILAPLVRRSRDEREERERAERAEVARVEAERREREASRARNILRLLLYSMTLLALIAGMFAYLTWRQAQRANSNAKEIEHQTQLIIEERDKAKQNERIAAAERDRAEQNEKKLATERDRAEKESQRANRNASEVNRQSRLVTAERDRAEAKSEEAERLRQEALAERDRVRESSRQSIALRTALQGQAVFAGFSTGDDLKAMLQVLAAAQISNTPEIESVLNTVWQRSRDTQWIREGSAKIDDVALSPDGNLVVVASNSTIEFLDAGTGNSVGSQPLERSINFLAMSRNGERIATQFLNGEISIWSLNFREKALRLISDQIHINWDFLPGKPVAELSPDLSTVLLGDADEGLRAFKIRDGEEVKLDFRQIKPLQAFKASANMKRMLIYGGVADRRLLLWRAGREVADSEKLQDSDDLNSGSFILSPDGQFVVAGSRDGSVRIWEAAEEHSTLHGPFQGHRGEVVSIGISSDSKLAVTGGTDGSIRLWDLASGRFAGQSLCCHQAAVTHLAVSNDKKKIVSVGGDDTVRFWSNFAPEAIQALRVTDEQIKSLAVSPDGTKLALGSSDNKLEMRKVSDFSLLRAPVEVSGATFRDAHLFRPYARYGGLGGYGGDSRRELRFGGATLRILFGENEPQVLDFEEFKRVVTVPIRDGYNDGLDYDAFLDLGSEIERIGRGIFNATANVSFSPDGKSVAFGVAVAFSAVGDLLASVTESDGSGVIRIVWLEKLFDSGEFHFHIVNELSGHGINLKTALAFSPDGKVLASVGSNASIQLWEVESGKFLSELRAGSEKIACLAFSPDGNRLVSGSSDGTLLLWDLRSGRRAGSPLQGHRGPVTSVAYRSDGRQIVSASQDGSLRLWDASSGKALGEPLLGHTGAVNAVSFSPDGRQIISGGADGTIRLWGLPTSPAQDLCKKIGRNMSSSEWNELVSRDISYIEQCPGKPRPEEHP